ncbi:MAG: hypothetical protein KGL39_26020 [Patescibacteria group bacterium]|nr:hypothetical protein [Patescibacteria group bacterium]
MNNTTTTPSSGLLGFLNTATTGTASILNALNSGNKTATPAPAATSSGIPSWIWYAGGGLVVLLLVLFLVRK